GEGALGRSSILPGAFPEGRCQHVVEPLRDFICGESEQAETAAPQIVAEGILSHGRLVRWGVDLKRQPEGKASEVDDKGAGAAAVPDTCGRRAGERGVATTAIARSCSFGAVSLPGRHCPPMHP